MFAPLFETVNKQPGEQLDTTDMPELESEESAEEEKTQRRQG